MKIENGLIYDAINVEVIHDLMPTERIKSLGLSYMTASALTIHNFGSDDVAKDVTEYVDTTNNVVAWHFTIGQGVVYQELPINIHGWHAGDGRYGTGNRQTIGIEIEEDERAYETAITFIAELLETLGWSIEEVTPHQLYSGKYCPRNILFRWPKFIEQIKQKMSTLHWADRYVKGLAEYGITFNEKRYDNHLTRAEAFAIAYKIVKGILAYLVKKGVL